MEQGTQNGATPAPGAAPNGGSINNKVSLAGVLNPDENRDSAYFSSTDASSRHTSAASCLPAPVQSSSSPHDKTPSPTSTSRAAPHQVSPSQPNMSVAYMVSPTNQNFADPLRRVTVDRPNSLGSGPPSATLEPGLHPLDTRRESVDSRMDQGFRDMNLSQSSPYASRNQSTTSVQSAFRPTNGRPALNEIPAVHRISNGYQPGAERDPQSKSVRTAPAITGPATSQIARAAEPIKGQPWAFPEDEGAGSGQRNGYPNGHAPSHHSLPPGAAAAQHPAYMESRRSSITESIASSQFTADSRLPAGQRRLDEDYRLPNASNGEFPPMHHHTMQNHRLGELRDEDAASRSSQPYSRTPELRKSHKLAERKRRTEMKELFDELRDLMPQERGPKASKWEILTKAITEHKRLATELTRLAADNKDLHAENIALRHRLHQQEGAQHQPPHPRQAHPPPPPPQQQQHLHQHPPPPLSYAQQQDHYAQRELPPLRNLNGGHPAGPDSMTGVQYDSQRQYEPQPQYDSQQQYDAQRGAGFRPPPAAPGPGDRH